MASKNPSRDNYFKEYRRIHREKIAEKSRKRYLKNREAIIEKAKPYLSEYRRVSRAKQLDCFVPLSDEEKRSLASIESTRRKLVEEDGKQYEIDHIIPFKYGGLHHPINVQIVESRQNKIKRDCIPTDSLPLISEHISLYRQRMGDCRADRFVRQIAQAMCLTEEQLLELLESGGEYKQKTSAKSNDSTLEDFMA